MNNTLKKIFALSILVFSTTLWSQESLRTNRDTELRAQPVDSASVLKSLPEKSAVQLLERQGAWSKVKADTQIGWVRMMHLRGGTVVASQESGGFFSNFGRLLSGGRSVQTTISSPNATVGVRGLAGDAGDSEEASEGEAAQDSENTAVQSAAAQDKEGVVKVFNGIHANPGALKKMQSFRADKKDTERFAKEAKLAAVEVAFFDVGRSR